MPSIHPDYEYDIFISYRHNDNIDGWVTRFVEALQNELKATLKNDISIYFDENPHDGLLETHQVDASLAKKLKCLVFIPIISQTYCDESSFAWEHEFLPFVEMAKDDELGMNITLSNGNVASRVLPVKIHRLDADDQNTLEAVLDGPLRSIDFIYHEPGVNRPLGNDDKKEENLNSTSFKNQVNKVANALKDIGLSIISQAEGKVKLPEPVIETPPETKSNKKGLAIGLGIIGLAMILYWGYTQFFDSPRAEVDNITIAVLAFDDQSPDGDQEWLGDGMADEILNVLAKVNGLQVTGKTSSFSFKGTGLTTKVIGETLNVSTVLEGSVSKIGKKLKITAQLIDVETDAHIWSDTYERDYTDIFEIQNEVAKSIASSLRSELSIEELEDIKIGYEVDPEAYEYYLRGMNFHWDNYLTTGKDYHFVQSENMFLNAIAIDSTYIDAYAGLADLYFTSDNDEKRDSIINIGYELNPHSAYILATKGLSFDSAIYIDSAFNYFRRAYALDPSNNIVRTIINDYFIYVGLYDEPILQLNQLIRQDPLNMYARQRLITSLMRNGNVEKAREACDDILNIDENNNQGLLWKFALALFYDNDKSEGESIFKKLQQLNPDSEYKIFNAWILALEGKKDEALSIYPGPNSTLYSILDMPKEAIQRIDSVTFTTHFRGNWTYLSLINMDATEFIQDEPEFKEILARAKKVHDERVAKYGHLFDE